MCHVQSEGKGKCQAQIRAGVGKERTGSVQYSKAQKVGSSAGVRSQKGFQGHQKCSNFTSRNASLNHNEVLKGYHLKAKGNKRNKT